MDDGPRSRIRQWMNLMQRFGVEPPREVRQAALPRAPLGSFGGWAAQPPPPSPPAAVAPPAPRLPPPQMPSSLRDQGVVARRRPQQAQRMFPVKNAPWGDT